MPTGYMFFLQAMDYPQQIMVNPTRQDFFPHFNDASSLTYLFNPAGSHFGQIVQPS